jgi:PIN domain nuclease of toxin-antitoxin system
MNERTWHDGPEAETRGKRPDLDPGGLSAVAGLGIEFVDVDVELVRGSARLRHSTRKAGLSLGDRVCLALGEELGLPLLTTNRAWAGLGLPLKVDVIR